MLADRYQARDLSDRLNEAAGEAGAVMLTQVLSGGGGVGKTRIAVRYATSVWGDPELRLGVWISAQSKGAVVAGYTQAAKVLLGVDTRQPRRPDSNLRASLLTARSPVAGAPNRAGGEHERPGHLRSERNPNPM